MSHKLNNKDIWAQITCYVNIISIVFLISFFIFAAFVSGIELESLAPYSKENWENIADKIIKIFTVIFCVSLGVLWIFSWSFLVNRWDNRTAILNKRLTILMIFIPLIASYYMYFEHRKYLVK